MKMTKIEMLEKVKELYNLSSLTDAETYLFQRAYDNIKEHLQDLYDDMYCEECPDIYTNEIVKNIVIAVTNELWAE